MSSNQQNQKAESHHPSPSSPLQASIPSLLQTLTTASHILHSQSIVDAYGHISVRNPFNPSTFFLSRSLAPALISGVEDFEEYYIEDASPVISVVDKEQGGGTGKKKKGFVERFIHSEVYKKYTGVRSVVHSHSEAVIPFGIGSFPLRPVIHVGGVMGTQVPVFDIANHYPPSPSSSSEEQTTPLHSLLITTPHLGSALASGFNPPSPPGTSTLTARVKNLLTQTTTTPSSIDFPPHPVLLMRGHGMTVLGTSIEEAVYRSVYTCMNARVQTTALLMQGSFNLGLVAQNIAGGGSGGVAGEGIKHLNEREVRDSWTQLRGTVQRAWELWCREVEERGLYINEIAVVD